MKKTYWTRINADRKGGKNEYVRGVIEGIRLALAGEETEHYVKGDKRDLYYSMTCSHSKYQKFKKLVEKLYQNLCDFDVEYTE